MRMMVIQKKTDTTALSSRLLASRTDTLATLQRLNPHANLARLQPGTVLLVPEGLAATEADSLPVGAEAFEDLSERLLAGLAAAVQLADKAHAERLAEGKAVLSALDADPVKRAMASDPALKAQAEQGAAQLQQDPAAAQAAQETFKRLQGQAASELALLARLLG
jgi:hypothetical protein